MRIISIRLENLNSMRGKHFVSLDEEPLASAGLFAITGPTGAGKSTLLDALTLSLYGKAARYGNEANPEHVMSRGCGECSAEVVFEVSSGIYRAVWQRHRARRKPEGSLQPPMRHIYTETGEPLAQQIREAEDKIEELLGLDYDRFLRSVLLAQGEFARFLKADANERAELLESLTGTEIYSRLSKLAFEEARQRENDLKAKETGLEQITILDGEKRVELEKSAKAAETELKVLDKKIQQGSSMLIKIKDLEESREQEKKQSDELLLVKEKKKKIAADIEKLRLHKLTIPFAKDLGHLETKEASVKKAEENREVAQEKNYTATKELINANQIIRASLEFSLKTERKRSKTADKNISKAKKEVAAAQQWLKKHDTDAVLENQIIKLSRKIGELKNARSTLTKDWSRWKSHGAAITAKAAKELPLNLDNISEKELKVVLDVFLEKTAKCLETADAEKKDGKKKLKLSKDRLERAKLDVELKGHRHELEDGKPCPLCGALEHPFAKGAKPSFEVKALNKEFDALEIALDELTKNHAHLARSIKELEENRIQLIEVLNETHETNKTLGKLLKPFGVKVPKPDEEDALEAALQKRSDDFRQHTNAEKEAANLMKNAQIEQKAASKEIGQFDNMLKELEPIPDDADTEPIAEDDLPTVALAEKEYLNKKKSAEETTTRLDVQKETEKSAKENLAEVKRDVTAKVSQSEFKTLAALRKARLPEEIAVEIEREEAALEKRRIQSETLLNQAQKKTKELIKEKVLEGKSAEDFKTQQEELQAKNKKLIADKATHQNQLDTDDKNLKRREKTEKELSKERDNLKVWKRLRELIGSADGRTFRRYAQSISLDILTRHANRHLNKLSDRYRICRNEDAKEQLTLEVEDLYQAGVRRPMQSLSGGESFLASLALALGLSNLAGRTIQIDSLFIDEGFGSLDSDTLDTAISALESLGQEQKTVGVISHVDLLKERISTQIAVEKMTGGWSKIQIIPQATTNH